MGDIIRYARRRLGKRFALYTDDTGAIGVLNKAVDAKDPMGSASWISPAQFMDMHTFEHDPKTLNTRRMGEFTDLCVMAGLANVQGKMTV